MIGRRVEAQRRPPIMAIVFGVAGLALLCAGPATGNAHLAVGSILPIALAVALFLAREPEFAAEFTPEAIEVEHPPATVPYADLEGLWANGGSINPSDPPKRAFPIQVAHAGGMLHLPARLDVPSGEVYRFLVGQFDPRGSREVNPALVEFLQKHEATYGPEQVWTYRGAKRRAIRSPRRGFRAACLALTATGVAWTAVGATHHMEDAWGPIGIVLIISGVVLFLLSFTLNERVDQASRFWKQASLVVSPGGLAMVQGVIEGELRWAEVLDVRLNSKARSFQLSSRAMPPGILVRVRGANIVITDQYDRPLSVIYERIVACRGGEEAIP